MNHDEAVGTSATERYLLHELPDDERDAFEEHFFDCAVCADDVKLGHTFVQVLPHAWRDPVVVHHPSAWRWNYAAQLATAANVIMASMLGWIGFGVIPGIRETVAELQRPHVVSYLPLESNRGDEGAQAQSSRKPFGLRVLVSSDDGSPTYVCRIIDTKGITRYSLPVTAAQTQDYVRIEVPAGALPPGNYTLRVDGKQPKIAEYSFTVD